MKLTKPSRKNDIAGSAMTEHFFAFDEKNKEDQGLIELFLPIYDREMDLDKLKEDDRQEENTVIIIDL